MQNSDVIVVGAGIMGLATSWYFVHKEHKNVLLLDQFPFPTTRNSSNGQSRIYRCSYEDSLYSVLMDAAMPLWRELEQLTGTTIIHECGLIYGGQTSVVTSVEQALRKNGSPHQRFTTKDLRQRWPQLDGFEDGKIFVHEPGAGFIAAADAILGYQKLLACSDKFKFLPHTAVASIHPAVGNKHVRVETTKGEFTGGALVLTAGPWANTLLKKLECPLPLEPQKVAVAYFKVKDESEHSYHHQHFPTVVVDEKDTFIYTVPENEYRGMIKIGNHHGIAADPDRRDAKLSDLSSLIDPMVRYVSQYMPSIESTPAIIEHCSYCCTPDQDYVIDLHPVYHNIAIGAGFSGHGFKMAPIVGQLLGKLSVGSSPEMDISRFRIARFHLKPKL